MIAGIEFDNVYDGDREVLYLLVGDPGTAVDFDGSPAALDLELELR